MPRPRPHHPSPPPVDRWGVIRRVPSTFRENFKTKSSPLETIKVIRIMNASHRLSLIV